MKERKIKEYWVVELYDHHEIIADVNSMMANGWQPYGPCQYSQSYHAEKEITSWTYVQTLVKYED